MKRLDKPTNHRRDNLLNIQNTSEISFKQQHASTLSANLESKNHFSCLPVFETRKTLFQTNQIFHIHLKPSLTEKTVEGEI
jgi:hypothetical protein